MYAVRVSYSLYRVFSEGEFGNETTEIQGERRKADGTTDIHWWRRKTKRRRKHPVNSRCPAQQGCQSKKSSRAAGFPFCLVNCVRGLCGLGLVNLEFPSLLPAFLLSGFCIISIFNLVICHSKSCRSLSGIMADIILSLLFRSSFFATRVWYIVNQRSFFESFLPWLVLCLGSCLLLPCVLLICWGVQAWISVNPLFAWALLFLISTFILLAVAFLRWKANNWALDGV